MHLILLTLLLACGPTAGQEFLGKFIPEEVEESRYRLGAAVAILGDLAVAGALEDYPSALGLPSRLAGTAHIFRRVGQTWYQEQLVQSPNRRMNEAFAFSVAITRTHESEFVFVNAVLANKPGVPSVWTGAVYVFRKDPEGWNHVQTLYAPDGAHLDFYGQVVRASSDLLVVGAPNWDGNGVLTTGAIYLYRYDGTLSSWELEQGPIFRSEPEARQSQLGSAVSVFSSGANEFVVASAPNMPSGVFTGVTYVYQRMDGQWVNTQSPQSLTRPDAHARDGFGRTLATSAGSLLIGTTLRDDVDPGNATCNSGVAYTYRYDGTSWIEEGLLAPSDAVCGDQFGDAVAISADVLAIAASHKDADTGRLHLYRFDGDTWVPNGEPLSGEAVGDRFGEVAMDGEYAIVGALNNDERATDAGAVYFYRIYNTPAAPGVPVAVQPVDAATGETPATLEFTEITSPGTTTLQILPDGPEPPAGFMFEGEPVYYEISTTAEFTGLITVCLSYADLNLANPRLLHLESGEWRDVTTSVDTVAQVVCGEVASLSPFIIVQPEPVLTVAIDIKPGSYPNSINLGSQGVVPVAILSTPDFDATQVDPLTVTLADAGVKVRGNGTPLASVQDANEDGLADLMVQVETQGLQLSVGTPWPSCAAARSAARQFRALTLCVSCPEVETHQEKTEVKMVGRATLQLSRSAQVRMSNQVQPGLYHESMRLQAVAAGMGTDGAAGS